MKLFFATAAASLLAGAAAAEPITIDDFNTAQVVVDTTANGGSVSSSSSYTIEGNDFLRTLMVNQTEHNSGDPAVASEARVGFGSLQLSNDSGANSIIDLTYDIDSLVDDVAGSSELIMSVIFTDASLGQEFSIEGYLNGEFLGSQTFTGPGSLNFDLPALAASGNELRLVFSGGPAFDAELGPVRLEMSGGIPVPEPGAFGLLGLGLASIAVARRRRRA